jgi:PRC-barrel domain
VLHTYTYEQLRELDGHEVVAADGEKIGYIDLVFRDDDTGEPEWLGIWDGLPDTKPRVLVPVRNVEVEDDVVRVPWPADVIRKAPSYEAPHNVTIGQDNVVDVSPETERKAYEHYGVEPMTTREEPVQVIRFRVWRIQSF